MTVTMQRVLELAAEAGLVVTQTEESSEVAVPCPDELCSLALSYEADMEAMQFWIWDDLLGPYQLGSGTDPHAALLEARVKLLRTHEAQLAALERLEHLVAAAAETAEVAP